MIPFINIHTHQIDDHQNNISITNWHTTDIVQINKLHFFSAGIHPWFIEEDNLKGQFNALEAQAIKPNCKAIGECGLDKLKGPEMSLQISLFEKQIDLAIQLKKPVIVHCVQAFDLLTSIIKKYQNKTIFIVHGFNQNEQTAAQLLKLGANLSFGNALLNVKNERLKNIFAQTSNNQIFIENDDTTIAVEQIYEMASSIKKCDVNKMKEIMGRLCNAVFLNMGSIKN